MTSSRTQPLRNNDTASRESGDKVTEADEPTEALNGHEGQDGSAPDPEGEPIMVDEKDHGTPGLSSLDGNSVSKSRRMSTVLLASASIVLGVSAIVIVPFSESLPAIVRYGLLACVVAGSLGAIVSLILRILENVRHHTTGR